MTDGLDVTATEMQHEPSRATPDWAVIVRTLGAERIVALCPYQQYADVIVGALQFAYEDCAEVDHLWAPGGAA